MADSTKNPLISVLIATYNRANSLCRAIESVLAQPGDYYELVIVNDASPDNTDEAVQPYLADRRVRYYVNPFNLGMQENYLRIFSEARGDYIFILTDDDWLVSGALEAVAQVIKSYPQVGYILSDLPTVDARTGSIIGVDRAFEADRLLEPTLKNMAALAGLAWVLSRQVIRRDLIDWETWRRFRQNIFFPIIFAGRAMLSAPSYYLAKQLVMHTWFNEVYWHKFGKDELDIGFNLAVDHQRAMRAILHDRETDPEARGIIERWELTVLKLYLKSEQNGFYDLMRVYGLRPAIRKLRSEFEITWRGWLSIGIVFTQLPVLRAWIVAKLLARRYAPHQAAKLKRIKNRWDGSSKARLN